jgi:hypothetical protein
MTISGQLLSTPHRPNQKAARSAAFWIRGSAKHGRRSNLAHNTIEYLSTPIGVTLPNSAKRLSEHRCLVLWFRALNGARLR